MSHGYNILSGAESAIRASTTFANANIFQREELSDDDLPGAPVLINVYLYPLGVKPKDTVDAHKFTVHQTACLIVFLEEYRAADEHGRDVVLEKKFDYNDAAITALRLNMPDQTYEISNIYQVDYRSTDYNPGVSAEIAGKADAGGLHRLLQVWEYHAYES